MAVNVPLHEESIPFFHRRLVEGDAPRSLPVHAVLLTNCIAPYSLPMLQRLSNSLASFRILVSTPMERDRHWEPVWDGLNVTVQKSFTIAHRRFFRQGFSEALFRHFPYDSLAWLYRIRPQIIISAQLGFRTLQAILYRKLNPKSRLILWVDARLACGDRRSGAWSHYDHVQRMGRQARLEFERKYTAERNYRNLMRIYDQLLDQRDELRQMLSLSKAAS